MEDGIPKMVPDVVEELGTSMRWVLYFAYHDPLDSCTDNIDLDRKTK